MPGTSSGGIPVMLDTDPLADVALAIRDLAADIGDPWEAYTATWSAATTNPAIVNGTITGRFREVGKSVHFRVNIAMGSSTTYGAGQYSVSLPSAAHGSGLQLVMAEAVIGGGAYRCTGRVVQGTSNVLLYCDPTTAGAFLRSVTPTTPGTFANGSSIVVAGSYERA